MENEHLEDDPLNEQTEPEAEPPPEAAPPKEKKPSLFRNFISFAGFALMVASLTSILLLVLIELSGSSDNPYTVLVTYIMLPGVMLFGLGIAIIGALLERRRRRKHPDSDIKPYPVVDLNDPARRRALLLLIAGGFFFLFISAFGSYRAFEYTESVSFCGQQCHTVMEPEFVTFNAAPHSSIHCVDCHVGGGPEWYVRSKFNGMRQLYAVAFNSFERPIHTPIHNMRKANETCAKCHKPDLYHGDKLRVFEHFGFDEQNSLRQIRMLIKVGGGDPRSGPVGGIHWHMNLDNQIEYIATDERRQNIPWVRMRNANGEVTEYFAQNASFTRAAGQQQRKAGDGLHRLPQPADSPIPIAEPGGRPIFGGQPNRSRPAFHQGESGGSSFRELLDDGRGRRQDRRTAD
jgi:hypothetical protein